ncbi:Holliday junction resolvase [Candidatus Woesearchaeota archaeon]|nr:Holliday junction resolvase [Candidatus Woesearchaeota archaeon]
MKEKGSRAERELVHKFYDTYPWIALRAPGSGSTPLPSPDVLATNTKRYLAIECKSIKSKQKTFKPEEIEQLLEFSKRFGAEPWIGIKFNHKGWFFIKPEEIKQTKQNNYSITLNLVEEKGIKFEKLIQ